MTTAMAMAVLLAFFAENPAQQPPRPAPPPASSLPVDQETSQQLAKVRRIYVDMLTGGESAQQLRDMLMSSLEQSHAFIVTEDENRADAVLRGSGDDTVFKDIHDTSDSINIHMLNSRSNGTGSFRGGQQHAASSGGIGAGQSESMRTDERKHEAIAAVRLVNRDGDVIWSATQESFGGKFAGASADVAARITRQLVEDYRRAKSGVVPPAAAAK